MLFDIYSREETENRIRQGRKFENTAIVSFYDTVGCAPIDYTGMCDDVFYVKIDDLESLDLDEMGITELDYFPDDDKLARFIISAYEDGKDIICQCEYGQGRSAGCMAAIKEYYFHDGIDIFADELYTPNKLVYHIVMDALKKNGGKR